MSAATETQRRAWRHIASYVMIGRDHLDDVRTAAAALDVDEVEAACKAVEADLEIIRRRAQDLRPAPPSNPDPQ